MTMACGAYRRLVKLKVPSGTSSQFDFFAGPGDSCWGNNCKEPSTLISLMTLQSSAPRPEALTQPCAER